MKAFPKVTVVTLALVMLFAQCEKEPDPNDPVDIPDQEFLNALIEQGVDINKDGWISYAEAEEVIDLDIDAKEIKDLAGLQAFINIKTLSCGSHYGVNYFTELDVTKNVLLEVLNCDYSAIQTIRATNHPNLNELNYNWGQLANLDVSNCHQLTYLNIEGNTLTSLDLSGNQKITILGIGGMKTLHEVCVWTTPFPPEGVEVDTTNSPNVYFTTDCSQ
jgi:hypothetical protein